MPERGLTEWMTPDAAGDKPFEWAEGDTRTGAEAGLDLAMLSPGLLPVYFDIVCPGFMKRFHIEPYRPGEDREAYVVSLVDALELHGVDASDLVELFVGFFIYYTEGPANLWALEDCSVS